MDCCPAPDLVLRCWDLECPVLDWERDSECPVLGLAIALDLASLVQDWVKSAVDRLWPVRQGLDWVKFAVGRLWAQESLLASAL